MARKRKKMPFAKAASYTQPYKKKRKKKRKLSAFGYTAGPLDSQGGS